MPKKLLLILILISGSVSLIAQQRVQYEINSIEFQGNKSYSSSSLKDVIYSQESPWWFWKFLHSFSSLGKEPSYFDSSAISIDLTALKNFYYNNGFFKAEFSYSFALDTAAKNVTLKYKISENQPSTYKKILLHGFNSFPPLILNLIYDDAKYDTTQRFSKVQIEKITGNIVTELLNNGYLFAHHDSTIIIEDSIENNVLANIYFNSGKRYTIDTVLIQKSGDGAKYVSDKLLRDISGIKENSYYSQDELRRSQVRLYRTDLFNSAILSAVDEDTTDDKVPVKLEGNIGKLNDLSPELIFNNQQNAFNIGLGASYIRKNFFGQARKLTISSTFGVQDLFKADLPNLIKKFSYKDTTLLGYVDSHIIIDQPYLFNLPIFGSWETYAKIDKQSTYNNTVYGTSLTIEFELPSYTFFNHLSTSYTVEQSNEVYRTLNDSLSSKLISDIAGDIGSTTVDNILFPTQGYNLSFHVEEANSIPYLISRLFNSKYSGSLFYKVLINSSYYLPLDDKKRSITAFKLKVGDLHTFYGNFAGVPINRTFYAGGSNSIRAWRSNQLVPVGSDSVLSINGVNNITGGGFLLESSIEYRYKLTDTFGIDLFGDLGNSWLNYTQFRFDGLAAATGLGFRYYTPVAPLRIDFAFKFYDPSDKRFIFQHKAVFKQLEVQFGIGEAF